MRLSKQPEKCTLRVADETLHWEEGTPIFFDDSYEHEVAHEGDEADGDRVVLLFDMWCAASLRSLY